MPSNYSINVVAAKFVVIISGKENISIMLTQLGDNT
jgi:hypothetical protein